MWSVYSFIPDYVDNSGNKSWIFVRGEGFNPMGGIYCRFAGKPQLDSKGLYINRSAVVCPVPAADPDMRYGHIIEMGMLITAKANVTFSTNNIVLKRAPPPFLDDVDPWRGFPLPSSSFLCNHPVNSI